MRCRTDEILDDGIAAVRCRYVYPGADPVRRIFVIGPADDVLAVRLHTNNHDRVSDFGYRFAPQAGGDWLLDQLNRVSSTGAVPVDVSRRFDDVVVSFEADHERNFIVTIEVADT